MNEENDVIKHSDFHLSKHGNKRIRINKINDNVKYIISRFTNHNEIDRLTPPVTFIVRNEKKKCILYTLFHNFCILIIYNSLFRFTFKV